MTKSDEDECGHPNGFGVYGCPCGATFESVREKEESMPEFEYRRVTTTRYEWAVPAPEEVGADWNHVQSALNFACRTWRQVNNRAGLSGPDGEVRVHSRDGKIVISFVMDHEEN